MAHTSYAAALSKQLQGCDLNTFQEYYEGQTGSNWQGLEACMRHHIILKCTGCIKFCFNIGSGERSHRTVPLEDGHKYYTGRCIGRCVEGQRLAIPDVEEDKSLCLLYALHSQVL